MLQTPADWRIDFFFFFFFQACPDPQEIGQEDEVTLSKQPSCVFLGISSDSAA